MQILTIDIGTGTQDIFLYDSKLDLENGFKMVLPSPTMVVNRRLKWAQRMGGGGACPCWPAGIRHSRCGSLFQR
jgi:uncharacterized protein (DUF1786 family)